MAVLPRTLRLLIVSLIFSVNFPVFAEESPVDKLPPHIKQITHFGQRASWSHDGKKILFLEKTFGDVFELELATGIIKPITHHYHHEGYTRATYLANGDIILVGDKSFNSEKPGESRSQDRTEMWVLKKNLKSPAIPLGQFCREAPAVSRKRMHIAWPHQNAFYEADIKYNKEGKPIIANKKKILDITKLPFDPPQKTQNFRPPDEIELTFAAYKLNKGEVMALNLKTKKIKNYSNAPAWYSEPEGIFPDGKNTLIESNKHDPRSIYNLDIYKLALDGSGQSERLTYFCEFKGYKATNPAVSDDGKFFAFQYAKVGDAGGVGRGILLFDIEEYEKNKK